MARAILRPLLPDFVQSFDDSFLSRHVEVLCRLSSHTPLLNALVLKKSIPLVTRLIVSVPQRSHIRLNILACLSAVPISQTFSVIWVYPPFFKLSKPDCFLLFLRLMYTSLSLGDKKEEAAGLLMLLCNFLPAYSMYRPVLVALSADIPIIDAQLSSSSPLRVIWKDLKALIEERMKIHAMDIHLAERSCGNEEVNQP